MQKKGRVKKLESFFTRPSFLYLISGSKGSNYHTHVLFASTLPQSYNLSIKAS